MAINRSAETKFWVIWREDTLSVTKKHLFRSDAEREAERLARQCPGSRFFILASENVCQMQDLIWKTTDKETEIPF